MFFKLRSFINKHKTYTIDDLYQIFLKDQKDKFKYIDILSILKNTSPSILHHYFKNELGSLFFYYLVSCGHIEKETEWIFNDNQTMIDPRDKKKMPVYYFYTFNPKQIEIFSYLFDKLKWNLDGRYIVLLFNTENSLLKRVDNISMKFGQYVLSEIKDITTLDQALLVKNLCFFNDILKCFDDQNIIRYLTLIHEKYPFLFKDMTHDEFKFKMTLATTLGMSPEEILNSDTSNLNLDSISLEC